MDIFAIDSKPSFELPVGKTVYRVKIETKRKGEEIITTARLFKNKTKLVAQYLIQKEPFEPMLQLADKGLKKLELGEISLALSDKLASEIAKHQEAMRLLEEQKMLKNK